MEKAIWPTFKLNKCTSTFCKVSVGTSHSIRSVYIRKTEYLMLYRKILSAYCNNRKEFVITRCRKVRFFQVRPAVCV